MRPHGLETIQAIQNALVTEVMPEVRSSFAQSQLLYMTLLLNALARHWDDGVQNLVDNHREMREILAQAADGLDTMPPDAELRTIAADLRAGAARTTPSLRMTALLEEDDALRGLLARLAPLCDRAEAEAALAPLLPVRWRLLQFLRRDAQQRIVPILGT
jgi:hypothetical protein